MFHVLLFYMCSLVTAFLPNSTVEQGSAPAETTNLPSHVPPLPPAWIRPIHWCKFEGSYFTATREYGITTTAPDEVDPLPDLDTAKLECGKSPGCRGITRQSNSLVFLLRHGSDLVLMEGESPAVSWAECGLPAVPSFTADTLAPIYALQSSIPEDNIPLFTENTLDQDTNTFAITNVEYEAWMGYILPTPSRVERVEVALVEQGGETQMFEVIEHLEVNIRFGEMTRACSLHDITPPGTLGFNCNSTPIRGDTDASSVFMVLANLTAALVVAEVTIIGGEADEPDPAQLYTVSRDSDTTNYTLDGPLEEYVMLVKEDLLYNASHVKHFLREYGVPYPYFSFLFSIQDRPSQGARALQEYLLFSLKVNESVVDQVGDLITPECGVLNFQADRGTCDGTQPGKLFNWWAIHATKEYTTLACDGKVMLRIHHQSQCNNSILYYILPIKQLHATDKVVIYNDWGFLEADFYPLGMYREHRDDGNRLHKTCRHLELSIVSSCSDLAIAGGTDDPVTGFLWDRILREFNGSLNLEILLDEIGSRRLGELVEELVEEDGYTKYVEAAYQEYVNSDEGKAYKKRRHSEIQAEEEEIRRKEEYFEYVVNFDKAEKWYGIYETTVGALKANIENMEIDGNLPFIVEEVLLKPLLEFFIKEEDLHKDEPATEDPALFHSDHFWSDVITWRPGTETPPGPELNIGNFGMMLLNSVEADLEAEILEDVARNRINYAEWDEITQFINAIEFSGRK